MRLLFFLFIQGSYTLPFFQGLTQHPLFYKKMSFFSMNNPYQFCVFRHFLLNSL